MIIPEFTAPSYRDRTLNEVQRMVNLYPEKTDKGWRLLSLPGLELLDSVANNAACRSAYCDSGGSIYSVHGTALYGISQLGADTLIGAVANPVGSKITWADNGTYVVFVDGTNGYYITGGTVTQITDPDFATPFAVTYQNSRFIISSTTGRFYISAIDDPTSWGALDFAAANYSGDTNVRPISVGSDLLLCGYRSIERWTYTGNADFPWDRIGGSTLNIGIRGAESIAAWEDTLFRLASNINGTGAFYMLGPGGVRQISTPYIESLVSPWVSQHDCYSFCWKTDTGHVLYEITFPSDDKTLIYDATSDAWLEASSNIGGSYVEHRPRIIVNRSLTVASTSYPPLAFDSQDGKVYKVTSGYNSENGTDLRRIRTFGPVGDGTRHLFHDRIEFVLEADHDSEASYTLSATLEWSDNGGLSWSSGVTLSKAITSGTTGQTVVLYHNRLGSSKERFYRLTFTGPSAKLILKTCNLEIRAGRH